MIVPCHLTPVGDAGEKKNEAGWCATCTRCGREVKVAGVKKRETRAEALGLLAGDCPKGEYNRYADRVIPRGVDLYFRHAADGKCYPLYVHNRTVCGAFGAVEPTAPILVVPADRGSEELACEFAGTLARWGHANVEIKKAGWKPGGDEKSAKPKAAKA